MQQNQLEPVSRHTVNLSASVKPKPVYTIYVADELDNNTISNWRAQAFYTQESTSRNKVEVEGIQILPVTINEYKYFLKNNIKSIEIINKLTDSVKERELGYQWRVELINSIIA